MTIIIEAIWILATTLTLTQESLLGTVGYECNEKAVCSTANSECRFDRCFCKDGYSTHFTATNVECLIFPALGESCNVSTDSRRSTCKGDHVVCVNGTCKCDTLYKQKNGACVLDEKGLTQSCTADDQCVTPFAECYQGKCACREGFSYSDGMCLPKEYYCAQGREPLRARDSIHYCTLYNDGRDTCPNGSYCVPLTKWQTSSLCKVTAKVRGFCCSIPNDTESVRTACPVGRPLPDLANCRQSSTHYMYVSKYAINNPLCCPNPCPQQYLYHDKRCIRNRLGPGSNCEIDLQCTCGYCRRQQDGEKQCVCMEGTKQFYGRCYAPSCFYGNASIDEVSKAPKTCSKANPQCPKDFICYAEFGLCCPRMPIMGMQ